MFWLKACPRCKGDLFRQGRGADASFNCLQCGHEMPATSAASLVKREQEARVRASA